MTNDDIKLLAGALQHRENEKESLAKINKILRNKSCRTLVGEYKCFMPEIRDKERNKALLFLVLAILRKNAGMLERLQEALESEGLIPNLYGALCTLFGGKNSTLNLKIKWTDEQFPNRYDYITRFIGQFGERDVREILYAVRILAMSDPARFEELAFKDSTRLILLNMPSYELEMFPSDSLIRRLMRDGDELQANIGFYFAVWDISGDVRDYAQLRRKAAFTNAKTKRQIDESIESHLEKFEMFYSGCRAERKASLLVNYILREREYPIQFGHWLMEAALQDALAFEITESGKITNLNKLCKMAHLVHDFPCKDNNGSRGKKDKLYAAIVSVLKEFVAERKGIYSWDASQEADFRDLCQLVPKRYWKPFNSYLRRKSKELMVSKLDEMVRFSIYLKDKQCYDICQGMMAVMDERLT